MMVRYCKLFLLLPVVMMHSCCYPPEENYTSTPEAIEKMSALQMAFLNLLPEKQTKRKSAQEEAKWLADTAVASSAAIARQNEVVFFGWMNNILVNADIKERGLCWQVQQDLYRDLRRRKLKYFFLGLTIRDRGTGQEHSCVYVNAKGKNLTDSLVLDAWKTCGYLVVLSPEDRKDERWEEDWRYPLVSKGFYEGHNYSETHHLVWPGWAKYHTWFWRQWQQLKNQDVVK